MTSSGNHRNVRLKNLHQALVGAINAQRALRAMDRASLAIQDFDGFVRLSEATVKAKRTLATLLNEEPADLALSGTTSAGKRLLAFTPSAKTSGVWQITRFDTQGEPWGDSTYTTRPQGIADYLQEVDLTSLGTNEGPILANARVFLAGTSAVDDEGQALLVYHGTQAVFDTFATNPRGIFFTEDRAAAESFTRIRKGSPVVKTVHLNIQKPWVMVRYSDDTPYSQMLDQSIPALKAQGYDGIHCPDDKVWIAFEPGQIIAAVATIDRTSIQQQLQSNEQVFVDAVEVDEVPLDAQHG